MIELQICNYNIVLWLKREWTLVLFLFLSFFPKKMDAGGTTPFLEEIIIGRCLDYQHTQAALLNGQRRNCTELWLQFKNSFSNKPPCSTSPEDYLSFIDNAFIPVPENKVLMWTGVFGTVQEYAYDGKRYFVLSDTLPGYMLSNLHFCGQETPPGINYDSCPKWGSCKGDKGDAEKSFWSAISVKFAQNAKGTVHVMLNGSSGNAYRNDSIFTLFELPRLNPQNVDLVKAFLIHGIGHPKNETCDTGTMLKLREDTLSYGFDYECNENPSDIMFFLCVDDADSKDCKYISEVLGTNSAYKLIYSELCVFISIAMLFRTL